MKISNFIIYVLFLLTVFISFILPNILLINEDYGFQMEIANLKERSVDSEVEDIYLVKMIHDLESENTKQEIVTEKKTGMMIEFVSEVEDKPMQGIQKELLNLEEKKILNLPSELKWGEVISVDRIYNTRDIKYTLQSMTLHIEDTSYELGIEKKTGKIISLTCDEKELNKDITQEELLRNYVEYLNLHIIDDWKYENNFLKSEKAGLIAVLVKNKDKRILCINTINKLDAENIMEYLDVN